MWWLHNIVDVLSVTQWYILKWWKWWVLNYVTITQLKQKRQPGPLCSLALPAYPRQSPPPPHGSCQGSSQPGEQMDRDTPVTGEHVHCWSLLTRVPHVWPSQAPPCFLPWLASRRTVTVAMKVKSKVWPPWHHSTVSSCAGFFLRLLMRTWSQGIWEPFGLDFLLLIFIYLIRFNKLSLEYSLMPFVMSVEFCAPCVRE